jgi:hypothetical protein
MGILLSSYPVRELEGATRNLCMSQDHKCKMLYRKQNANLIFALSEGYELISIFVKSIATAIQNSNPKKLIWLSSYWHYGPSNSILRVLYFT